MSKTINKEASLGLVEQIIKKNIEDKVNVIFDPIIDEIRERAEREIQECHEAILKEVLNNIKTDSVLQEVFDKNARELIIRTFINDEEISND